MRCAELAALLARLEPSQGGGFAELREGERPLVDAVVQRGWADVVTDDAEPDRLALEERKARLRELRARAGGDGGLDPAEQTLRDEILALSARLARLDGAVALQEAAGVGPYRDAPASDASGPRLALTASGRALLGEMRPRLARVGEVEVDDFIEDMRMLEATLSSRAGRAAQILASISQQLVDKDEMHLRSAAVGLAARRDATGVVADGFVRLVTVLTTSPLPDDREIVAAESKVVRTNDLTCIDARSMLANLLEVYTAMSSGGALSPLDAANAALLATSQSFRAPADVSQAAAELLAALPPGDARELAPAVHLVVSGATARRDLRDRLAELEAGIRLVTGGDPASFAAAALLAAAPAPVGDLLARFGRIRGVLGRFSAADSAASMSIPSALLGLLAADAEEILADLRLAGAAIANHKLSLGAFENVSLAVKLLLTVGILALGDEGDPEEQLDLAPRGVPSLLALGAAGLGAALPIALSSAATFHWSTLHKMALSDFQAHPAHSHYGTWGGGGYYG